MPITYRRFVDAGAVTRSESGQGARKAHTAAVARYLFKLMAYKDEYEVARLYSVTVRFAKSVAAKFKGDYEIRHHLAPPLLAKRDPETGHLQKQEYGPWMMQAIFRAGKTERPARHGVRSVRPHRRAPHGTRELIADYRDTLSAGYCWGLKPANLDLAVEIASVPEDIRGYGHVKERHVAEAKARSDAAGCLQGRQVRAPVFLAAE